MARGHRAAHRPTGKNGPDGYPIGVERRPEGRTETRVAFPITRDSEATNLTKFNHSTIRLPDIVDRTLARLPDLERDRIGVRRGGSDDMRHVTLDQLDRVRTRLKRNRLLGFPVHQMNVVSIHRNHFA